jgi:hypothetical protein
VISLILVNVDDDDCRSSFQRRRQGRRLLRYPMEFSWPYKDQETEVTAIRPMNPPVLPPLRDNISLGFCLVPWTLEITAPQAALTPTFLVPEGHDFA